VDRGRKLNRWGNQECAGEEVVRGGGGFWEEGRATAVRFRREGDSLALTLATYSRRAGSGSRGEEGTLKRELNKKAPYEEKKLNKIRKVKKERQKLRPVDRRLHTLHTFAYGKGRGGTYPCSNEGGTRWQGTYLLFGLSVKKIYRFSARCRSRGGANQRDPRKKGGKEKVACPVG